ncbi:hypothetical protein SAMN04487820_110150 [Actinopolyspora mzabensis]|uniref:Uncharacterized protein n=1 Tax=Actinopolyspora mzabensis TaxID=995066 RepID=A0A1G9DKP9_ACTMZ|nr:hypothetical protein SAMN04487820_110150 [Actinopolyspora mzabensis]
MELSGLEKCTLNRIGRLEPALHAFTDCPLSSSGKAPVRAEKVRATA